MLWYHVSDEFIGYQATFMPKVFGTEKFALRFEGNVPRICVSNNIFFCIRAKTGRDDLRVYDLTDQFRVKTLYDEDDGRSIIIRNPSVYVTEETPYYPPNYSDFRRNNEMWFVSPTKFQFIGFLSIDQVIKNHMIRFTNQEIEQIWIPKEINNKELNPYMDPMFTNNEFFYDSCKLRRDVEKGIVPMYVYDYGYENYTEEQAKERLRELGVLK